MKYEYAKIAAMSIGSYLGKLNKEDIQWLEKEIEFIIDDVKSGYVDAQNGEKAIIFQIKQ